MKKRAKGLWTMAAFLGALYFFWPYPVGQEQDLQDIYQVEYHRNRGQSDAEMVQIQVYNEKALLAVLNRYYEYRTLIPRWGYEEGSVDLVLQTDAGPVLLGDISCRYESAGKMQRGIWGAGRLKAALLSALAGKADAKRADDVLAAVVNGVGITWYELEAYAPAAEGLSEKQVLDRLMEQKLKVQMAQNAGCTVTLSEVLKLRDQCFARLEQDEKARRQAHAERLGMSQEAYEEFLLPIYEGMLLYEKWKTVAEKELKAAQKAGTVAQDMTLEQFLEKALVSFRQASNVAVLDAALQ